MYPSYIPSATLILIRERSAAPPEMLMIERGAGMNFAPGALVFPGGRIDPGDHAAPAGSLATATPLDPEDAAARIAAIRETIEEAGIAVGIEPAPAPEAIRQLRAALHAGADFLSLLDEGGYRLDLDQLTPFARWRPDLAEKRYFDTRFYLARAPRDGVAEADGGESVRSLWITAGAALDAASQGHHRVIFPTVRNLERLARLAGFDDAVAHALAYPVEPITPWIETREGEEWLCIPEGLGYPVTAALLRLSSRG